MSSAPAELYENLRPGQFVSFYLGMGQQRPMLGIIDNVGEDSVDVIYFPRFGQLLARATGVWHRDDPRVGQSDALGGIPVADRGMFVPLPDFVAHLNLVAEVQQLQKEIAALKKTIAQLKQGAANE